MNEREFNDKAVHDVIQKLIGDINPSDYFQEVSKDNTENLDVYLKLWSHMSVELFSAMLKYDKQTNVECIDAKRAIEKSFKEQKEWLDEYFDEISLKRWMV